GLNLAMLEQPRSKIAQHGAAVVGIEIELFSSDSVSHDKIPKVRFRFPLSGNKAQERQSLGLCTSYSLIPALRSLPAASYQATGPVLPAYASLRAATSCRSFAPPAVPIRPSAPGPQPCAPWRN